MSSRSSRITPQRGNMRNTRSRRNVLVDLNVIPQEDHDQEISSAHSTYQDVPGVTQQQPVPIDVEAFDDDILISSPTAFAQAKNNSRRNRANTVVVDVESVTGGPVVSRRHKRMRRGQTIIKNDELYINLEGSSNTVFPHPPPPSRETTFRCPVCLGQLVDATSTKCGHVFCKGCLKAALAVQSKCPTCRKRSVLKDTIRIYLPATD